MVLVAGAVCGGCSGGSAASGAAGAVAAALGAVAEAAGAVGGGGAGGGGGQNGKWPGVPCSPQNKTLPYFRGRSYIPFVKKAGGLIFGKTR